MIVNLVVGVDRKTHGIGCKGGIPWKNKEDMQWFKKLTTGNAVIMGWTTFVSLGRPLPNRLNIVISPDLDATTYFTNADNSAVRNARSLEDAISIAESEKYPIAFVMGGASIYRQYLEKDLIDTMYVDFINNDEDLEFDTFFPFDAMHGTNPTGLFIAGVCDWAPVNLGTSSNNKNNYVAFHRKRSSSNDVDSKYIKLLKDIKESGQTKHTRAGETLSVFGRQLRFNAFNQLPIITTKKMYSKGCIVELLWFISGSTNIKYLIDNNCHIWDDDAYRHYKDLINRYNEYYEDDLLFDEIKYDLMSKEDFLEAVKKQKDPVTHRQLLDQHFNDIDYICGDLGPVYGKQWNDWDGINQIDNLIKTLKANPDDRRLMISAWNVGELSSMALPPCHYLTQWYTTDLTDDQRKEFADANGISIEDAPSKGLSVMWNQRSVDTCLGLPYNILGYSIFLYMIAQCVNMAPLEVICNLGDVHIYKNQLEGAEEQILRNPCKFNMPKLKLNKSITDIWKFTLDDIKIDGYESYPTIKFPLSVG